MPAVTELPRSTAEAKTASSKFLLLTGTAPGEPGVGGVILRDLVQIAGVENCQCCWLAPKHCRQEPFLSELTTTIQPRRFETGYRPVRGLTGELISAVALRLMRPNMIHQASITVERMIRKFRPEFLLAVLESPAAIQVALAIHKRTGIPLRVIVWDDVDLFCRQGMFDRWTRAWIERTFERVLKVSERIAVICENMQNAYGRTYAVNSFVLRHGIPAAIEDQGINSPGERDILMIGFAGSNTAADCLNALLRSLDDAGWRLDGRDIVLRMLGVRHMLESRQPQHIEYFGWRSVTETRQLLSDCDLLYLPQSFSSEARTFSELSFPTKLSTYVAARRPIFLHAPAYASLSGFWRDYELGPCCHNLDLQGILGAIRQVPYGTPARSSKWLHEISRVHEQVLSQKGFEDGVRQLVG